MKKLILFLGIIATSISCDRRNTENIILYADREAPLGWIHLTIYKDSTFEYVSRGISARNLWKGKALITNDSIRFNYFDSIPIVGERAYYTDKYIDYLDMDKNVRIEIKINKLKLE